MKNNKVAFHAKSIYTVPVSFYQKLGIKALVVDLDNTLAAYDDLNPDEKAVQLKKDVEALGIAFLVVSNNREERVKPYTSSLGVKYLSSAHKFSGKKIGRWLDSLGYRTDDCLFVGDQLYTDRIYVNHLHGRLLLTDPLVKKDHFFTRFIRWYDNYKRAKWLKKGLLGLKAD